MTDQVTRATEGTESLENQDRLKLNGLTVDSTEERTYDAQVRFVKMKSDNQIHADHSLWFFSRRRSGGASNGRVQSPPDEPDSDSRVQ